MEVCRKLAVIPFLVIICATVGCGGGGKDKGPDKPPITGDGRLTTSSPQNMDDSRYSTIHFKAARDGYIVVSMSSDGTNPISDPYLLVYEGGSDDYSNNTYLGSNDDGGSGLDARYRFWAERDETYSVKFTTYGSGSKTGTYYYSIVEDTRGMPVSDDSSQTATGKIPSTYADKQSR